MVYMLASSIKLVLLYLGYKWFLVDYVGLDMPTLQNFTGLVMLLVALKFMYAEVFVEKKSKK